MEEWAAMYDQSKWNTLFYHFFYRLSILCWALLKKDSWSPNYSCTYKTFCKQCLNKSSHLLTFHCNLFIIPRSEAEPALLVRSWVVEQWSHVRPLLPGRELLSPKRQEDHHHPPAAGRCAPRGRDPQRTAAQDEHPTVSAKNCMKGLGGVFLLTTEVKLNVDHDRNYCCSGWFQLNQHSCVLI